MSDKSAIEWTDATWNVVTGCTKVSPGCAHCYIDRSPPFRIAGRKFVSGSTGVTVHPDRLVKPLRWTRPRMIFVNSLSDMFHEDIPREIIDRMFAVMALCPQHTFQILTKRPERMLAYFETGRPWQRVGGRAFEYHKHSNAAAKLWKGDGWPLPNVWLGVTIESARFTYRADLLRETPAAIRFISAEPLLGSLLMRDEPKFMGIPERTLDRHLYVCNQGHVSKTVLKSEALGRDACLTCQSPVRMTPKPLDLTSIDWLIAGGESGPGARAMNAAWAKELRDECVRTPTAFFFKQWGGKTAKAGGKILDGREWCEMPVAV